ncbi:MAG: DUF2064 domain-containing protein [Thermoanaerobaculia bacterium]
MSRYVVLFAREPGREARAKGFDRQEAAELFAAFAAGWARAADSVGARLVLATPPEDMARWRRTAPAFAPDLAILQRGASFGERLKGVAAQALRLGGPAVIVGGDVAPSATGLAAAFARLEEGCDAVLCPAPDGGVSLLSVPPEDLDLLRTLPRRRRDVFAALARRLVHRGRRLAVIARLADVDGRRALRRILRGKPRSGLRALMRGALARLAPPPKRQRPVERRVAATPNGLRAPPAAA